MKKSIIRTLVVAVLVLALGLGTSCKKKTQKYNITLELNGGTLTTELKEYDGSVKVTLPTPTKDGFNFGGWYNNAGFTGAAVTEIAKGETGDKTFFAKWNEKGSNPGPDVPTDETKWPLNPSGFDGQGMDFLIKVLPVNQYDPFDANFADKQKQARLQSHQRLVEDAYNIKIVYSAWDNEAPWGPERVNFIKNSFNTGEFQKKNVYVVTITSQWIPTLVKAKTLAELYNTDTGKGIFATLNYEQNAAINEATSVKRRVYGYDPGIARPDYFMYYNATKVAEIGMEDPAEMWFKGEWNWSNFDKWVRAAQTKLAKGEYAIDCGYAEFIMGAAAAQGTKMIDSKRGTIMFTKAAVTSIFDKMKSLSKEGFWDKGHGVQDVSVNFKSGKTLLHSGELWFLKETTRFTPAGQDGGIPFKIGMVPYPVDNATTVTPYTAPYTYIDTEGNEVEVTEPLKSRSGATLTNAAGESIYGIDLSESNFLVPYTGTSCYSIINFTNGANGITPDIAFNITHDLVSAIADDPADAGITDDEAYRTYLKKKTDNVLDIEVIMSVQGDYTYYELMEVASMTVGSGSHFGPNGFWPLAASIVTKDGITPSVALREVEGVYKEAVIQLGY